jgi:hypothetical protein
MYITPYQKKQLKIVVLLLIGIPLTIFAGYRAVLWITGATGDVTPQNIVIGNISSNSITVSWTTSTKTVGAVVPMQNGEEIELFYDNRDNSRRNTHIVEVKRLEPSTTYQLKILSGEEVYAGDSDRRLNVTTAGVEELPPAKPINGGVDGADDDVLVYVLTKDKSTYPLITETSGTGNWLLNISQLRKVSDNSHYTAQDSTNLRIIAVSEVGNAGLVEGEYGSIFDSNGTLNTTLVATGSPYDSYIPEEAKIYLEGDPSTGGDDDDPYVRPDIEDPDDEVEDDERDYELRNDLYWIDMVTEDGLVSNEPVEYGEDTVLITNLTDTGFNVLWYSRNSEVGYAMYGTSENNLENRAQDERDGLVTENEYILHSLEFPSLTPETTYYFEIHSGDDVYDNDGAQYEVTTLPTQESLPQFEAIAGSLDVDNVEDAVVIAKIVDDDGVGSSGESMPTSSLLDSDGAWIITLGFARAESGEYFVKSNDDLIEITPKYLTTLSTVTKSIGEAISSDVVLSGEGSGTLKFVKIPLLEDYGILSD